MKTFKIFILLILFSLGLNAQGIAVKTKRFFWADSEVNFNQQLTESGKELLNSTLKMSNVDLTDCIGITSDEELQYTSSEYLRNRKYQFITMSKYDDVVSFSIYDNKSSEISNQKKKVILTYSKDNNNKIDVITLHVIE
jgi:hypothetical protein